MQRVPRENGHILVAPPTQGKASGPPLRRGLVNRAKKDHFIGDGDRFQMAMRHIAGRRITYQELTGKGTDSLHHEEAGTRPS